MKRTTESYGQNLALLLHDAHLKLTASRMGVLKILHSSMSPLRVKDIYEKMKAYSPGVDMVTIYRTIKILQDKQLVHRVDFGEDAAYYELTSGEHDNHYITCTHCSKRARVDFCEYFEHEPFILKKIPDFVEISRHATEYSGLCKKCAKGKSKPLIV